MLEIKARELFPDAGSDLAELSPEEAAEELAERLEAYRRMKSAAAWLSERLDAEADRYFRLGPAPLAPQPELRLAPQDPPALPPCCASWRPSRPQVSLAHMQLTFPPVAASSSASGRCSATAGDSGSTRSSAAFRAWSRRRPSSRSWSCASSTSSASSSGKPFGPIGVLRPDVERSAA